MGIRYDSQLYWHRLAQRVWSSLDAWPKKNYKQGITCSLTWWMSRQQAMAWNLPIASWEQVLQQKQQRAGPSAETVEQLMGQPWFPSSVL